MYGKEKTIRKQLRVKGSAIKCANELCQSQNRSFNNLIETLIFNECGRGKEIIDIEDDGVPFGRERITPEQAKGFRNERPPPT